MEADVNVLVVGSSTARRGAIGRHFTFPHIRRCRKPVFEALSAILPAGRLGKGGRGKAHRAESWERGGKRGGVCLSEDGGQPSLSLY